MVKFWLGKIFKKCRFLIMRIFYWKYWVGNFLRIDFLKFLKFFILVKKEKRKKNIFLLYYVLELWRVGMNENEKEWKKN